MMFRNLLFLPVLIPSLLHSQHAITMAPVKCIPENYLLTEVFVTVPENVGTVLKGAFNRPEPATIAPDIRSGIFNALNQYCPANEGGVPIAIKVNELVIHETSAKQEYAGATLNIDVLREEDGQWVHLFNSGGTVGSVGLDVTGHHSRNLTRLLEKILGFLHTGETGVQTHFPALAGTNLSRPTTAADLWIPIKHSPLPTGLFKTFDDMRLGRTLQLEPTDRLYGADLHKQATKLRKKIWGYSDGTHLYVLIGKDRAKLERAGPDFIGNFNFTEHDPVAVIAGGAMFGLLGGIVANEFSKQEHHVPVILDLMTGDLRLNENPEPEKDVAHIIYMSRFGDGDGPVRVLDGGEVLATLERYTYCEIFYRSGQDAKQLELESATGERLAMTLSCDKKGYSVHLVQLDEEGAPELRPVNKQMKEKLFYSFKEKQRRPLAFEPAP